MSIQQSIVLVVTAVLVTPGGATVNTAASCSVSSAARLIDSSGSCEGVTSESFYLPAAVESAALDVPQAESNAAYRVSGRATRDNPWKLWARATAYYRDGLNGQDGGESFASAVYEQNTNESFEITSKNWSEGTPAAFRFKLNLKGSFGPYDSVPFGAGNSSLDASFSILRNGESLFSRTVCYNMGRQCDVGSIEGYRGPYSVTNKYGIQVRVGDTISVVSSIRYSAESNVFASEQFPEVGLSSGLEISAFGYEFRSNTADVGVFPAPGIHLNAPEPPASLLFVAGLSLLAFVSRQKGGGGRRSFSTS